MTYFDGTDPMEANAKRRMRQCLMVACSAFALQAVIFVLRTFIVLRSVREHLSPLDDYGEGVCLLLGGVSCIQLSWGLWNWDFLWRSAVDFRWQGQGYRDPAALLIAVSILCATMSVVFVVASVSEPVAAWYFLGHLGRARPH